MRRTTTPLLLTLILTLTTTGCGFMNLFNRGDRAAAKEAAVTAVLAQEEAAFLAMTALGLATDNGAFGAPGSVQAEAKWEAISAESIRINRAINAWKEAVAKGEDTKVYSDRVSEAMEVLKSYLPKSKRSEVVVPRELLGMRGPAEVAAMLGDPGVFRRTENVVVYGGVR